MLKKIIYKEIKMIYNNFSFRDIHIIKIYIVEILKII